MNDRELVMAIEGYELHRVMQEYVTADLVVWKRYRRRAPGILEKLLDANPHLGRTVHPYTPFIPPGTYVRVPIDPDFILGRPKASEYSNLWTDQAGYRL